jgi:hypothetical protein
MAGLGTILAGGPIGTAAGQFGQAMQRGALDRQAFDTNAIRNQQNQTMFDFQNQQMDRAKQEQDIENAPMDAGATDEMAYRKLAEIAGTPGPDGRPVRGDLQRKYTALADKAKESGQLKDISNAARATLMGDPVAVGLWNKQYKGGTIIGIQPKIGPDGSPDPSRNFMFSIKDPATGQVHPVEVPYGFMEASASDPKQFGAVMQRAQLMQQNYSLKDRSLDQKDTQIAETERYHRAAIDEKNAHDKMMMQWKRSGGGSGKLPNEQWRAAWAKKPISEGGGGMTPQAAMAWAADPNRSQREWQQNLRLGTTVAGSGGMFTADDVVKIAQGFAPLVRESPIVNQPVNPNSPEPKNATFDFKAAGFTPDPHGSGSWKNPRTGVWFKTGSKGELLAWSNTRKTWVPAQ